MANGCTTCNTGTTEVDPNQPINPNTGENYPDWYPETLQGLTYNTGASTDILGTQVNTNTINPNTGENFTPEEVMYYTAPTDLGDPNDPNNPYYTNGEINWDSVYGSGSSGGGKGFDINVPGYQKSPEQQAWEEMYSGYLQDALENPQGIPEDIKAQMQVDMFNTLKAQEAENIRVMRNNMERRGITNSGFMYSNEQKIRSNTTKVMAQNIRNVEIQDAMMKLSSFENAMGRAAQYLGYLGEESYKAYQPKLMEWQAKFDIFKMELNQAYQQENMQLQSQLESQLMETQHQYNVELAEMQLEAQAAQGQGQLFGSVLGGVFSLAAGSI